MSSVYFKASYLSCETRLCPDLVLAAVDAANGASRISCDYRWQILRRQKRQVNEGMELEAYRSEYLIESGS